jgi:Tol biopolymer transport system component
MYGGAPHALMPDVSEADWDPAGKQLAIVRRVAGWHRLEYPIGSVLYQTAGWIGDARFSPRGDQIAFSEHPKCDDDRGRVVVVNLRDKVRQVAREWESVEGLVWNADGSEVWYAASESGDADEVYAFAPGKRERLVTRFPTPIKLLDMGRDGKLLFVTRNDDRRTTWQRQGGREQSQDWLGSAFPADLSKDGKFLLFSQYGAAGGSGYGLYIQKLGGSAPIRLGDGDAIALSPDGNYALALQHGSPQRLVVVEYNAGTSQLMPATSFNYQPKGQWFPDSQRILFEANEPGHPIRIWMQKTPSGAPQAITPEGVRIEGASLNPDGTMVAARCPDGMLRLFPISGGSPVNVPGIQPGDRLVRWRPDGRKLVVMTPIDGGVRLDDVDTTSGARTKGTEIIKPPLPNFVQFTQMLLSTDGGTIVYGADTRVRTLYLAEGLK